MACHGDGFPGSVHHGGVGVAALYDIACTVLAPATLRGHTQIDLDILKALAFTGVMVNLFVGYAVADTNNHGWSGTVEKLNCK